MAVQLAAQLGDTAQTSQGPLLPRFLQISKQYDDPALDKLASRVASKLHTRQEGAHELHRYGDHQPEPIQVLRGVWRHSEM